MVAGSILPITIHNNKLHFLFGKENSMEKSAKGWSDFGGGCENNESPYQTAIREGGEELTGFLGDKTDIKKLLKKGGIYKIINETYHMHLFFLPYDENLPKYYNNNHKFLWERMNKHTLNNSKLFEKIEIKWFSIDDMKTNKKIFRNFYQEIVDKLIEESENIYQFALKKSKLSNKRKTKKIRRT